MKKSSFEEMGGTYRQVGDYLIPNFTLPPEAKNSIGVWGQRHRDYLRQYKKITFYIMLTNGTLWSYLAEIDKQATNMFYRLVDEIAKLEGVDEKLKEENQMKWVSKMNSIRETAIDIINNELIYV